MGEFSRGFSFTVGDRVEKALFKGAFPSELLPKMGLLIPAAARIARFASAPGPLYDYYDYDYDYYYHYHRGRCRHHHYFLLDDVYNFFW